MAVQPFIYQAINGSGAIESGAKAYVYDAGTSTLSTVYTAAALTAVANPQIAGSNGILVFWLDDGSAYDIQVKTADDATILLNLESYLPDGSGIISNQTAVIATVAAAKLLTAGAYPLVYIEGRTSAGDGYEGLFRWDGSDLSTEVTADTENGVYVPPNSDATGASGAWVRVFDGALVPEWFGAAGDGAADDSSAFSGMVSLGEAVDKRVYTLDPSKTYLIEEVEYSEGFVLEGNFATLKSKFNGSAGAFSNTLFKPAAGVGSPVPYIAVRDIIMDGDYDSGVTLSGEARGFDIYAKRVDLENVHVKNWALGSDTTPNDILSRANQGVLVRDFDLCAARNLTCTGCAKTEVYVFQHSATASKQGVLLLDGAHAEDNTESTYSFYSVFNVATTRIDGGEVTGFIGVSAFNLLGWDVEISNIDGEKSRNSGATGGSALIDGYEGGLFQGDRFVARNVRHSDGYSYAINVSAKSIAMYDLDVSDCLSGVRITNVLQDGSANGSWLATGSGDAQPIKASLYNYTSSGHGAQSSGTNAGLYIGGDNTNRIDVSLFNPNLKVGSAATEIGVHSVQQLGRIDIFGGHLEDARDALVRVEDGLEELASYGTTWKLRSGQGVYGVLAVTPDAQINRIYFNNVNFPVDPDSGFYDIAEVSSGTISEVVLENCRGIDDISAMASNYPPRSVVYEDEFLGDALKGEWSSQTGSDPQVAAPAIAANLLGICRMITGDDATGDMATNGVQLQGGLNWRANIGGLEFECILSLSAVTDVSAFIGFTDQVASLEMPFTLSGTTYTSNASNAVGFLFDTAADTDTIRCVGVAGDTDAAHEDSGAAFSAATKRWLKMKISSTGVADYWIDGQRVGAAITGAVSAGTLLTPVVAAFSRGAASRNIDIDYIRMKMNRTLL